MKKDLSAHILIVDDEPLLLQFLSTSQISHGYSVAEASTGTEVFEKVSGEKPDLMILDLGLPDIDGMDVLRRVRANSSVPIIVLSAREKETDKVFALDLGADDYVTKPFSVGELMARVRSTLRRRATDRDVPQHYKHAGLTVDIGRRKVVVDGKDIKLTPKEFSILTMLVGDAGRVVPHQSILREVWGPTYTSETHYLRVYVGHLRQKIEADPTEPYFILTEAGVGYRLRGMDEEKV